MTPAELARRALAYALGLGTPLAVLSPLLSGAPDSFPISTYPMFAQARGQLTLYSLIAVSADDRAERVPPELVGTQEVLQAKVLIQRSVAAGLEAMARLCTETASRVATDPAFVQARKVAIVERRYDPIDYFVTGSAPLAETRLYECQVDAPLAPSAASR